MRRTLSSLVLFAVATILSTASFASDSDRAVTLKAAELARFEAQVNGDAKTLGLVLDDQLEYVHSNGDLDTKASFIEALANGKRDYISTTANIQSVRILGDVGIIRGTAKVSVASNGKTQDLSIGYTDVWVWKANRWQMTAWRSAKDPAPAAAPAVPMPPSTPKVN